MVDKVRSPQVDLDFSGGLDQTRTSDEDRTLLPELTGSMSKRYEDAIRRILTDRVPQYVRIEGTHLRGEKSGVDRQIDVLLKAPLMEGVTSVIVVECKRYARPVGIGTVDELCGKLIDVGAEHGVLCAPNGFTRGAETRAENARHPTIVLYDLSGDEEVELENLPGPDCPAFGCEWGWVSWANGEFDSGESVGMGRCDRCGSMAVKCKTCGHQLAADGDDQCYCGFTFMEDSWHDGSEWVIRVRTTDGDETRFDWTYGHGGED